MCWVSSLLVNGIESYKDWTRGHGLERSNRIPVFMVEEDGTSVLEGIREGTEVGDELVIHLH